MNLEFVKTCIPLSILKSLRLPMIYCELREMTLGFSFFKHIEKSLKGRTLFFELRVRNKKCPQFQYLHETVLDLIKTISSYEQRKK